MISKRVINILRAGGVGIIPTDTIYGLVGSVLNKKTVERIYKLRRRDPHKPMIILIGLMRDLGFFGIKPDRKTLRFLKAVWFRQTAKSLFSNSRPLGRSFSEAGELKNGPISAVLPLSTKHLVLNTKLKYLHRGTKTLAFRLPKPHWLRQLLAKVGPLVAPSANPEGKPPAHTIREAKKYFGNRIDFYVDGGSMVARPSRLIKIEGGKISILRK